MMAFAQEVISLHNSGVGPREIARRLDCSPGRVSGVLWRAGMTSKDNLQKAKPREPRQAKVKQPRARRSRSVFIDRDQVAALYLSGAPVKEISALVGCTVNYVQVLTKGLPRRYRPRPRLDDASRRYIIVHDLAGVKRHVIARNFPGRDRAWVASVVGNTRKCHPEFLEECASEARALRGHREVERAALEELARVHMQELAAQNTAEAMRRNAFNESILAGLSPRNRDVCRLVLVEGWTLNETGRKHNITRERVRQTQDGRQLDIFKGESDPRMSMGYWTRKQTEQCWLFTRGKPKRLSKGVRQVIRDPRREHSRKPDEQYARIEALVGGPYLELFARQQRPGWTSWGNQVEKFEVAA